MFMWALVTGAFLQGPVPAGAKPERLDAIRKGMTPEEVRRLLGPPQRQAREILYRRYVEQWQYDDPAGWVEFNCPKGEVPSVIAVHHLR